MVARFRSARFRAIAAAAPLFALVAGATPALAQSIPAINDCKQGALGELPTRSLEVGEAVEIQTEAGPITYTARPGESIWTLCATTLRASEAFLPRISSAQAAADEQRQAAQAQQEALSKAQAEAAQLRRQVAAAAPAASPGPAGSPAGSSIVQSGSSGSSGSAAAAGEPSVIAASWLPWAVAALAALAAIYFFSRTVSLGRRRDDPRGA